MIPSMFLWRIGDDHNFTEIYVLNQVCSVLSCVDVISRVLDMTIAGHVVGYCVG